MKTCDLFDVTGLACVITGGAGGLGMAFAEALLDNGAHVRLLDLDPDRLADARVRLAERGRPGQASGAVVDVRDRPALKQAIDAAAHDLGRLDVVFANCGVPAGPGFLDGGRTRNPEGALEAVADELWDATMSVNLSSVMATIQAASPHMKRQRSGRIVVTSSIAGLRPGAIVGTPYGVTKAAVNHLVRQAALELAAYNVLVNAIVPGPFATRITTPDLRAQFERGSPMHKVAEPEDIQGLALLLASPAGKHITGTQLVIDGGSMLGVAD